MFDKAGGLDIVAMREDKFLILCRGTKIILAQLAPAMLALAIGSIHTGVVKSMQTYGVFCALEGAGCNRDGLLHVSQLHPAGDFVASPSDLVAVGDRVRVRVLKIETDGRISLSAVGVVQQQESLRALQVPVALGAPPTADELEQLACLGEARVDDQDVQRALP